MLNKLRMYVLLLVYSKMYVNYKRRLNFYIKFNYEIIYLKGMCYEI